MNRLIKFTKVLLFLITIFVILYFLMVMVAQAVSTATAPKINSQAQLEQIIQEEKKRAGINEDIIINIKLSDDEDENSHSNKTGKGKYEIVLSPLGSNLSTLRHELYHIANGDCDEINELGSEFQIRFNYFLLHEPKATIYQTTGFKI